MTQNSSSPSRPDWATRLAHFVQGTVRSIFDEVGRTRRVVVTPEDRPATDRPIFIIGVHRSGTTLVRMIVDSHSRIACPPESFFLLALRNLLADPKAMEGLEAMGFRREAVVGRLRDWISYFYEIYAASHEKARWADKTPSYVDCLDFIEEIYGPSCRYVLVYRHGLDSACSIAEILATMPEVQPHLDACDGDPHAAAARYWATQCGKMRDFARARPSRCLDLFYEKLNADPEAECRRLFEFLEEPFEPGVLAFHEKPHDVWVGLQDRKASSSRGFQPNVARYREQSDAVVDRMVREAGAMLDELGYEVERPRSGAAAQRRGA